MGIEVDKSGKNDEVKVFKTFTQVARIRMPPPPLIFLLTRKLFWFIGVLRGEPEGKRILIFSEIKTWSLLLFSEISREN